MIKTAIIAACSWASPGANAYTGDVLLAVDNYADIPAVTRERLKARMQSRQYDEITEIRRDSIAGAAADYADLRMMHFGAGTVCVVPERSAWADSHLERGLVYCEDEHCLIVPTVCRNVSRVTRIKRPAKQAQAQPTQATAATGPGLVLAQVAPMTLPELPAIQPIVPAAEVPQIALKPASFVSLAQVPIYADWTPPSIYYVPAVRIDAPVPAVPEPGTWLMMLAGVGLLAFKVRHRSPKG